MLPSIGLLLILYSVFTIDFASHHPGLITLIPVIGTMLIIKYADKGEVVTRLLSSKAFVGIGLISYSLYLWHYPIFAFARIHGDFDSVTDKASWFILSFIGATLTYFLIEKPFRRKNIIGLRLLGYILILWTCALLVINFFIVYKDGYPSRLPGLISNIETDLKKIRVCKKINVNCSYYNENNLFLLGDSHMFPLERPLLEYAEKNNISLNIMNQAGCPYILNMNRVNKKTLKPHNKCTIDFQNQRRDILLRSKPSTVIVGGRLPMVLSEERFNNMEGGFEGVMKDFWQNADNTLETRRDRVKEINTQFRNSMIELVNHGHKVILVYPIPEVGWHVPKLLKKLIESNPAPMKSIMTNNRITTSYELYKSRTKENNQLLDSIKHDNIIRVYPHEIFCDKEIKGRCITYNDNSAFYRDANHLSDEGAKLVLEVIVESHLEFH